MKFKINEEVLEIASGKKCIVVATKEEPYTHTYNQKEMYPPNNFDYIVLIKIDTNQYKGEMYVYEHQLIKIIN
ncbi:hypothetical protein [Chryseobacterium mucoviscidosis]|uniref:Uncharacterized protein n=1 Tax=Chryseobacterium mucoviscidosis TaxID=1945581 RepID=A0A202CDN8_9FLAO|nr:hypothetical protein [Chryseobacterium mucoviscidosis]OVE61798.1 hypothetical protein B0E34_02120 [Chryseobacterium mucoviscidosis]